MQEPIYEFDFPVPFKKPPIWFPKRESFNLYVKIYFFQHICILKGN